MTDVLVRSYLHLGPDFSAPFPTLMLQPTDWYLNPFSLHLHSNYHPKKAEKSDKSPQSLDIAAFPPSVSFPGKFRRSSGKAVKQYGQGPEPPSSTDKKRRPLRQICHNGHWKAASLNMHIPEHLHLFVYAIVRCIPIVQTRSKP